MFALRPLMTKMLRANRGFIAFLLLFALFRTAVADWNPIPSGSMRPNLLEGDVVFVNRLAYHVKLPLTDVVLARTGEPRRGDIVTFSSPIDGTRLIKRLVAGPGDVVEMRGKRLTINGQAATYSELGRIKEMLTIGVALPGRQLAEQWPGERHLVQWLDGANRATDFGPLTIPADQYLMLGDNRDNSADSRFIGLVPRPLLIGRAERILVSAAILDDWMPRLGRFGQALN